MTVPNAEQVAAWDGPSGLFWVENAARYAETTRPHNAALLASRPVAPGDAVLDVGCGSGGLTRAAARLAGPGGSAFGVDLSGAQVVYARSLSADLAGVAFEQADAQTYDFGAGRFDALVSQFGTMFFDDPAAAFANLARAVRPGGRLTMVVWAAFEDNEWVTAMVRALAGDAPPPVDASGPFALSAPGRVRGLLTGAGFAGVELDAVHGEASWGADVEDAYPFVLGGGMVRRTLAAMPEADRPAARDRLRATLADHATADGVRFRSKSWLVTARRS
ncbi:MAG TPA: methyltransferase domain-containing protein [Mycobacteriales bacterium]